MTLTNTRCRAGECVYEAFHRDQAAGHYPGNARVVVAGMGVPHPAPPAGTRLIGVITVRPGESSPVVVDEGE